MRQGPYELLVVDSSDTSYEERELGGKPCIRAEPAKEYHVRINVYRNAQGKFPAEHLRFGLYIDGVDVQYWKRIDLSDESLLPQNPDEPVTSRFWGFKKNVNDIRSFVFSVPDTTPHQTALSQKDYKCLGSVRLEVYEACVTYGTYENQNGQFEAPSTQQIGENEKFWRQASLTTAAGRRIELEKEKFLPLPRWKNLRKTPDAELLLLYHTAAMMDFLEEHQDKLKETTIISKVNSRHGNVQKLVYDLTSDAEDELGEMETRDKGDSISSGSSSSSINDDTTALNSTGKRMLAVDSGVNLAITDKGANNHKRYKASSALDGDQGDKGEDTSMADTTDTAAVLAPDEPPTHSEIPIDEEISYVVHKKIVPFLDLSEEGVEHSGVNVVWSTLTS